VPTLTRIYVPADSAALALGADDVATAIAAEAKRLGAVVEIVRNGSRGMHWLEPLVEVQTASGRIGYGPVAAADVPGLIKAGLLEGGTHPLCIGTSPRARCEGDARGDHSFGAARPRRCGLPGGHQVAHGP
jgi:formate dehydrogenase iron-sulfur subunit